MKLVTALTCGMLSLNALALPVLTELQEGELPVYQDHVDPNLIHVMPNEGGLSIDRDEAPKFYVDRGIMSATFRVKANSKLQDYIDEAIAQGKRVSYIPALSSFLHVKNSEGYFLKGDLVRRAGRFEDEIGFMAILTEKGATAVPKILRSKPASFRNFSACFQVMGASPEYSGEVNMALADVHKYFTSVYNPEKTFTKTSIKEGVKVLLRVKWIQLTTEGTEAQIDDYAAAITDRLIMTKLFSPVVGNRFVVREEKFGDEVEKFELKGTETITREHCIDLKLGSLKIWPELIN